MHTQIKSKKYEYNNNNHTDEIKKEKKRLDHVMMKLFFIITFIRVTRTVR